ncbi:hypothetical protein BTR23_08680 [Alkalihalophilus pseudofirmus]|uniref:hypothetical protein n=1 Tax=Alkalihalobacterium alkalinitrilicum TaxID=427920 RepID=UPI00094C5FDA|nr:hypothetical protein [Alkalihalobacterium alkalinitrilicum]OLO39129.1 hypothetical protein BTR23_08680 [Alkalihalophilus pseudofirmus]
MLKELKGNLSFFVYDHRYSVTIFWSVLLLSSVVFFVIAALNSDMYVGFSMSFAVFLFCAISGFLMTKETFPFLIKLGSTRNQYVFSALVFNLILATFMSALAVIVNQLSIAMKSLTNVDNFNHFMVLEGTTIAATWYNELLFNIIICFLLLQVGFMMSSLFYRLGLVGGFSGIVMFALILIIPTTRNILLDIFVGTNGTYIDINYISIILLSILAMLPNWLLLKDAPTTGVATR